MFFIFKDGEMQIYNSAEDIDPKDEELRKIAIPYEKRRQEQRARNGGHLESDEFWYSPVGLSILKNPKPFIEFLERSGNDEQTKA